jgi:hypothetical protein
LGDKIPTGAFARDREFVPQDGWTFRYGWSDGVAELNLELVFVGFWPGGFPQVGHFAYLAACAVASVDYDSFAVDFAESNKFPRRAKRSRPLVMLAR